MTLFAGGRSVVVVTLLQFSLVMILSGNALTTASTTTTDLTSVTTETSSSATTSLPTTTISTSALTSSTISTDSTTVSTTLPPTTDSTTGSTTTLDSTTSLTSPTTTTDSTSLTTTTLDSTTSLTSPTTTTDSTTTSTIPTSTTDITTASTILTTTTTDSTTTLTSPITTSSSTTVTTTSVPVTQSPLNFQNISVVVTINVRETKNKVLDTIVCKDNNNHPLKVSLLTVEPRYGRCANCFQIVPCSPDWCLKYIPNIGTLEISRDPVYTLNITCSNTNGNQISWLTEIRLTTNEPPMFNNSGFFVLHTVPSTRNIKSGAVIYIVSASDIDGDTLHYTMTVTPDNGNFKIGEYDGVIRATNNLSRECSPAVTFEVYVTDKINSPVGPLVISTTLNDSNTAPLIKNMGGQLPVKEDTNKNAVIYSIDIVDDVDKISSLRFTLTTVPAQAWMYFNISGKDIVLTSQLDYENPPGGYRSMTLKVEAIDSGGCSSGVKTLSVEVTDVNEAPSLVPNTWTTAVYEGLITVTPQWIVEDPDINDVARFSIAAPNYNFVIDPTTGTVSHIGEYDYENKSLNKSVSLSIVVTDRGNKTGTGILNINILDANDNEPSITAVTTPYLVEACKLVGSIIATLSAKDSDSSFQGNNVIYFRNQSSTYFSVMTSGSIFLSSPIQAGDYSSAVVYAYDQGQYPGPLQSKSAFIAVNGIPCKTTTALTSTSTTTASTTSTSPPQQTTVPTTKVEYNFMAENLQWMMVAALLGTCFLGLLTLMICRYVLPSCSRSPTSRLSFSKPLKVKPVPSANTHPLPRPDNIILQHTEKLVPQQPPTVTNLEESKLFDFWTVGNNIPD